MDLKKTAPSQLNERGPFFAGEGRRFAILRFRFQVQERFPTPEPQTFYRFRASYIPIEAKRYRDALYPEYACKEDDEDYNSIEVRIPDALKLPTYLNRVDDCLEKNARKALTQELGFGALEEGLSNLMVAIMKRARKNEEFKRTSYIAPYELADIAREVILEKFK